jgi:hypothetical protein
VHAAPDRCASSRRSSAPGRPQPCHCIQRRRRVRYHVFLKKGASCRCFRGTEANRLASRGRADSGTCLSTISRSVLLISRDRPGFTTPCSRR